MKKISRYILGALILTGLNFLIFSQVADAATAKLATPEITVANVADTGKIKIKWKEVKNAVSYKVYRSSDGKTWKELVTTKNTSVVNTSAVAGKKYYYKVKSTK